MRPFAIVLAVLPALAVISACDDHSGANAAAADVVALTDAAAARQNCRPQERAVETTSCTSGTVRHGATGLSEADAVLIVEAALESAFEISVAQLALRKGEHPTVRAHADMAIRDNAQLAAALEALAMTKQIRLYLRPDPHHVEHLVRLRLRRDGYDFDLEYASLVGDVHTGAIRLYERMLTHTRDGDVRDFASSALQLLRSRSDVVEQVGADGTT